MAPSSNPSISVIIPTYGRPVALRQCVASLVSQQYPRESFEVIVVDDGGDPPAISSLPAELARDIHLVLVQQSNQGASVARGAGIASARGRVLAFLDDDCTVPSDYL